MNEKTRFAAVLLATLLGAGAAPAQEVRWEVVERFRLVDKPEEARALFDHVRTAPARAAQGGSFSYPSPLVPLSDTPFRRAIPATAWDAAQQRYAAGYAHPRAWSVKVSVPGRSGACDWTLRSSGGSESGPCAGTTLQAVQAEDEVSVTWPGAQRALAVPIAIQHRRVVVLGDSYASGEGVPEINQEVMEEYQGITPPSFGNFAYWWDQKCHRSLLSAGVQSSLKWAMAHPHRSVTTLSYACSGAEIGHQANGNDKRGGLLDRYHGRETREQLHSRRFERFENNRFNVNLHESDVHPLLPQINQAVEDLCSGSLDKSVSPWACKDGLAQPDLLVFSIGGNDVGFADIIKKGVFGSCRTDCVKGMSEPGFATLQAGYDAMAASINERLAPRKVLMLDYGDPTRDGKGAFCSTDGSPVHGKKSIGPLPFLKISRAEYEAAYRLVVRPLNRQGDALVARNRDKGWARLKVMERATRTKGICSESSWFNSTWSAYFKQYLLPDEQYSSGVAHPNIIYQSYQADAIVDWMNRNGF